MRFLDLFGKGKSTAKKSFSSSTYQREQQLWKAYSIECAKVKLYAGFYSPNGVPCCDNLSEFLDIYPSKVHNTDSLCPVRPAIKGIRLYLDSITLPCCEHLVLLAFNDDNHLVAIATEQGTATNTELTTLSSEDIFGDDYADIFNSCMPLYEVNPYKDCLSEMIYRPATLQFIDCFGLSHDVFRGHGYQSLGVVFHLWSVVGKNPLGITIHPNDYRNHIYLLSETQNIYKMFPLLRVKETFESRTGDIYAMCDISDTPYLILVLNALASTEDYLDYHLDNPKYAEYREDAKKLYQDLVSARVSVAPDGFHCYVLSV